MGLKILAWLKTRFGQLKSSAGMRQVKQRGIEKVEALLQLAMAAAACRRIAITGISLL